MAQSTKTNTFFDYGITSRHDTHQKQFYLLNQVHGTTLIHIDQPYASNTSFTADASYTTKPGIILGIKTADCLPILIANPPYFVAAIHAGRKGTESNILSKTLQTLQAKHPFSTPLWVWFGPHICEKCYQIDQKTDTHYSLYQNNKKELDSLDIPYTLKHHPDCTYCNEKNWYSYRAQGPKTGRNISWITLMT